MKPIFGAISVLALSLTIAADESRYASTTPAQHYTALLRDYQPASSGLREAKTDLQRIACVQLLGEYPARFVALAEKYPKDPVALKALKQAIQAVGSTDSAAQIAWETNESDFPTGISDDVVGKIVALLRRDHLLSDQLGPICDRMRYGYRLEFGKFLNDVLKENPHRDVKAVACLSLAQFLNDRLRMLELADDRPELIRRYEVLFGKNYLKELQRPVRVEQFQRIEELLERSAKNYADVELRAGGNVGARAKSELYEIRHLSVGKTAPDIEGLDQNGARFKLSDYRGKVVLLYFWMEY